jgi:hypothetical protein
VTKTKLWGAGVNLSGISSRSPMALHWDSELKSWWDRTGDWDISELGCEVFDGRIKFADQDRRVVASWISGAEAMANIISGLVRR